MELETDKVTIEVPAPAAGVLGEIAAKAGETVAVGALLGQIKEGEAPPARPRPPRWGARTRKTEHDHADQTRRKRSRVRARKPCRSRREDDARVAPSVRRLAAETGVDASTGPAPARTAA